MGRLAIAAALVVFTSTLVILHTPEARAQKTSPAAPSGTGGGVDAATANNPTARLDQVQLQSWYNPAYIDEQGQGNEFVFQAILAFDSKGALPSSIERLTVPLQSLPNGRTGLGDTTLVAEFFPGYHHQNIKAGFGPVIVGPSATNRYAGNGQWQVPVERTHGLQAAGRGAVELPVRATAGSQRGTARRAGEAGPAEAPLRLSPAACTAEPARPGGQREACVQALRAREADGATEEA